jgi:hypothetical protein
MRPACEGMRLVKACKTITTCSTTRPCWAPHQAISDVRLIGSRLVKNVTQLSQQQAVAIPSQYIIMQGTFFTN